MAPRWVGDAVLSQSLLKLLRLRHPTATIEILASPFIAPIFSYMPEVNGCLECSTSRGKVNLFRRIGMAFQVRKRRYDWAIVMPSSFKSAIVPWLARIPKRSGTNREFRYLLINDPKVTNIAQFPLATDRACLLGLDKKEEPTPGFSERSNFICDEEEVARTLQEFGIVIGPQKSIALVPGSEGGDAKRWPAEHYAEAAIQLLGLGFQIWLIGSEKETGIAQSIQTATQSRCLDLCGKTSLDQAVHILSAASSIVCNDSGLMHVAAALNKPIVAIYGPTHAGHTPPLSEHVQIISLGISCSPCYERNCPLGHHDCMRKISPVAVVEQVKAMVKFMP